MVLILIVSFFEVEDQIKSYFQGFYKDLFPFVGANLDIGEKEASLSIEFLGN